jgi:hypothetical protein
LASADFVVVVVIVIVPEVEIHSERLPISDDKRDRKNFTTGPVRYPTKHVPGCIPELEKCWERCINSGEEYFEGDECYLVVSLSINVFKKVRFLCGQTTYVTKIQLSF